MSKFLAALAVSLLTITAAQAAEFVDVDANADGLISMDEAKAAMPDLVITAFVEADANGDGALNSDEFAALNS